MSVGLTCGETGDCGGLIFGERVAGGTESYGGVWVAVGDSFFGERVTVGDSFLAESERGVGG